MRRKNQQANELRLIREGAVDPTDATATIDFIISEMAAGKPLQCQQHASPMESLFVFMANGICATLHRTMQVEFYAIAFVRRFITRFRNYKQT